MTTPHSTGVENADLQIDRVYEAASASRASEEALIAFLASKCKPGHMVHGSLPHTTPGYRVMLSYYVTDDGTAYIIQNAGIAV